MIYAAPGRPDDMGLGHDARPRRRHRRRNQYDLGLVQVPRMRRDRACRNSDTRSGSAFFSGSTRYIAARSMPTRVSTPQASAGLRK